MYLFCRHLRTSGGARPAARTTRNQVFHGPGLTVAFRWRHRCSRPGCSRRFWSADAAVVERPGRRDRRLCVVSCPSERSFASYMLLWLWSVVLQGDGVQAKILGVGQRARPLESGYWVKLLALLLTLFLGRSDRRSVPGNRAGSARRLKRRAEGPLPAGADPPPMTGVGNQRRRRPMQALDHRFGRPAPPYAWSLGRFRGACLFGGARLFGVRGFAPAWLPGVRRLQVRGFRGVRGFGRTGAAAGSGPRSTFLRACFAAFFLGFQ